MPHSAPRRRTARRLGELRRSGGPFVWGLVPRRARGKGPAHGDRGQFTWSASQDDLEQAEHAVWRIGPVAVTSILLGITTGMIISGLCVRFETFFGACGIILGRAAVEGVIGATLLALAMGVRVPQRFALWLCMVAWRRFLLRGQPSDISRVYVDPDDADRPLYWVVLSVIALGAGLTTALLPLSVRLACAGHDWMYARFIWTVGPLAILRVFTVLMAGLIPLTILGLALSCVHHLSCPYGRWETRATAWLLIGAAAGTLAANWIFLGGGHGNLILIAAALPALVVSLVAATSGSSNKEGFLHAADTDPPPLPLWSDRRPTLLRAGIVTVGAIGVCTLTVWAGYFAEPARQLGAAIPALLMAMGIGVCAGCRTKRSGLRSVGGFGVACTAAGVVVAAGPMALTEMTPGGKGLALFFACIGVAAVGFAMAYGRQTLLHRVAARSYAGATVLSRTLVSAALVVWVGVPVAVHLAGSRITFTILALALLTLGGVLIINEPGHSPRTRWARLCAVLCSIAAMVILAWSAPHLWRSGLLPVEMPTATHATAPYPSS